MGMDIGGNWRPHLLRRGSCLAFIVLLVLIGAPAAFAAAEGDIELLRLVAMAHKDNKERVRTWVGTAQIVSQYGDAEGLLQKRTAVATFTCDYANGGARWRLEDTTREARKDGRLVSLPEVCEARSAMLTGDGFFRLAPGEIIDQKKLNTLVICPPDEARVENLSNDFDPLWYLTCLGHDVEDVLLMYSEDEGNPDIGVKVTRGDGVISLELSQGASSKRYDFDLSQGGNLVRYRESTSTQVQEAEWTYLQHGDLWMPESFVTKTQKEPGAEGGWQSMMRSVRFIENTINAPVDASEFSLAALGVTQGIRVSDHRLGLLYRYGADPISAKELDELLSEIAPELSSEVGTESGESTGQASEQGAQQVNLPDEAATGDKERAGGLRTGGLVALCAVIAAVLAGVILWRAKRRRENGS